MTDFVVGQTVQGRWINKWLDATIIGINQDDTCTVKWLSDNTFSKVQKRNLQMAQQSLAKAPLVQRLQSAPVVRSSAPVVVVQTKATGKFTSKDQVEEDQSFGREITPNAVPWVRRNKDLFSWLGWAPESNSPCYQSLHKHFPGVLPGTALFHRVKFLLNTDKYGMTPDNTLFGHSICPDEINHEKGGLADIMKEFWGECFPLGGIGGAPFVGKTGFVAFSHHVPEDGHILIMFGPHIAISNSGELGKILRHGQTKESTACGAVLAGYKQCLSEDDHDATDDMQQAWIRDQLKNHVPRIQNAEEPLAELANAAYEMVAKKINSVVNTNFGSGHLVLIGGIQINMPEPHEGHFAPKLFEVRGQNRPTIDLLSQLKVLQ